MDLLMLSRLQFAMATFFHFLFVPLTLGLSVLIAVMETIYVKTRNEQYKRMAKFWGKLFLINFAIGIVTGITLEFQFGTNWSRYSEYVGDIFGSLLAIEATLAFFLESTFIAVWAFGWKKLSPGMHAVSIWLVALASNISGYWILSANAWMQHPVGYVIRNGRAELTDFLAVITQGYAVHIFIHTISSAYVLAGFVVLCVSSYHLLKKQNVEFFTLSFRIAAVFTLIFSVLLASHGHINGKKVADLQPSKLAAMEAHWETTTNAPMYLLQIPDPKNRKNAVQLFPIPGMLSILATHSADGEVKGLNDFPQDELPPVLPVFISFRAMVGLGMFFILLSFLSVLKMKKPESSPFILRALLYAAPLPYIAIELGWVVAEVGRQPWIVYGMMKTADAVSRINLSQVAVSFVGFLILYSLLGFADFFLLLKYARKGPDSVETEER